MSETLMLMPGDSPEPNIDSLKRADLPAIWGEYRPKIDALKATAETLAVKDATDLPTMRLARETRLALKGLRCDVETRRKELVEGMNREVKKINAGANELKALIEPLEDHLRQQEEFAARAEAARKQKLATDRGEQLAGLVTNTAAYNLAEMTDEDFTALRDGMRAAAEQKAAETRRREEERAAKAKAEAEERERIRLENERLRRENEEREAQLKTERAAAEKARQEAEAAARQEREALEAKARAEREAAEAERRKIEADAAKERSRLQAEARAREQKAAQERAAAEKVQREAREKAEAEARALREAEARRLAEEEAARQRVEEERQATLKAPDREKLHDFSKRLRALELAGPLTSDAGKGMVAELTAKLQAVILWIDKRAREL